MKAQLPVLGTPSRTETGLRCHRRHFLDHIVEVRPEGEQEPASLEFGRIEHVGVAQHWMEKFGFAEPVDIDAMIMRLWKESSTDFDDRHSAELAVALGQYYRSNATVVPKAFWAHGLDSWKPVMVDGEPMIEKRLRVETPGGYTMTFMVDRLVESPKLPGVPVLVDLKTAAPNRRLKTPDFYRDWEEQWMVSIQMRLYKWGLMKVLGLEEMNVLIEGLLKALPTQLRPVMCPDWDAEELAEAVRMFDWVAEQDEKGIEYAMVEGEIDVTRLFEYATRHTQVNYMDCMSYYQKCKFWDLCRSKPDARLGLLMSRYERFEGDFD